MKLKLRWAVAFVTVLASVTLVAQRSLLNTGLVIDGNGNLLVTNNAQSGVASGARSAANTLVKVDANSYLMVAMGASTVPILAANGSAAAPSYAFSNETGSGLYRVGAGDISLQVLGTSRFEAGPANTDVKAPDGGAYLRVTTGQVNVNSAAFGLNAGVMLINSTAPTVTSAGTSPSVVANGTASFRVNVGTGGTATTIVMGMPAATTGWNCLGSDLTAAAANRNPTGALLEQSSTTTAVTMQYQTVATGVALAFTASDIVLINCTGF